MSTLQYLPYFIGEVMVNPIKEPMTKIYILATKVPDVQGKKDSDCIENTSFSATGLLQYNHDSSRGVQIGNFVYAQLNTDCIG